MDYNTLYFVFFLLSAICFLLSFLGNDLRGKNLIALGLLLWVMVAMVQTLRVL